MIIHRVNYLNLIELSLDQQHRGGHKGTSCISKWSYEYFIRSPIKNCCVHNIACMKGTKMTHFGESRKSIYIKHDRKSRIYRTNIGDTMTSIAQWASFDRLNCNWPKAIWSKNCLHNTKRPSRKVLLFSLALFQSFFFPLWFVYYFWDNFCFA